MKHKDFSEILFRPTYARIDLRALEHNYNIIKEILPFKVDILGIVKADAYGHGAVPISKKLVECGVSSLGVATVEEGIELRDASVSIPIVVMGGLMGMGGSAAEEIVKRDLTAVIHSKDVIDCLESAAKSSLKKVPVHLKIDTGMSRLGVRPESLIPLLKRLAECEYIYVQGVMTHFANACDKEYTEKQINQFLDVKDKVESILGEIDIWHTSNTEALFLKRDLLKLEKKKIWVRPGIGLYGVSSRLKPVMSLESRVALLKTVPVNTPVSYGCTYITKRKSRLGVVPIGYADGYRFNFSKKAHVLIRETKIPIVGRITMDMIIVDLTDLKEVCVGDRVVLMGTDNKEKISAIDLAKWANTIPYEIFCGISKRIPRIYIS